MTHLDPEDWLAIMFVVALVSFGFGAWAAERFIRRAYYPTRRPVKVQDPRPVLRSLKLTDGPGTGLEAPPSDFLRRIGLRGRHGR